VKRNALIVIGFLIVFAVAIAKIGQKVVDALGAGLWWVLSFGLVLIVAGVYMELQRKEDAKAPASAQPPTDSNV
jgi:membrane protein CcdC involved in cytochrome C biogenesis